MIDLNDYNSTVNLKNEIKNGSKNDFKLTNKYNK